MDQHVQQAHDRLLQKCPVRSVMVNAVPYCEKAEPCEIVCASCETHWDRALGSRLDTSYLQGGR